MCFIFSGLGVWLAWKWFVLFGLDCKYKKNNGLLLNAKARHLGGLLSCLYFYSSSLGIIIGQFRASFSLLECAG
jgi:hypothetical protein